MIYIYSIKLNYKIVIVTITMITIILLLYYFYHSSSYTMILFDEDTLCAMMYVLVLH